MKKYLTTVALFLSLHINAQQWDITFTHGFNYAAAGSAKQTADGSIYFLGSAEDTSGVSKFVLTKFDSLGNVQWYKSYGDSITKKGLYLALTGLGELYMVGESINGLDIDYTIAKVDTQGNLYWMHTYYDAVKKASLKYITTTSDGGAIACGYGTQADLMNNDFMVVKFDSAGAEEWQQTYGVTGTDNAQMVQQTPDGGYIVSGDTKQGDIDNLVVKLNAQGNEEWRLTIGDNNENGNQAVFVTSAGDYLLVGESSTDTNLLFDIYLARVSAAGSLIWTKYIGGSGSDAGFGVVEKNNEFFISGYSGSLNNTANFFLLKLNAQLNPLALKYFPKPGGAICYDIVQGISNNFLLAGAGADSFYLVNTYDDNYTTNFNEHSWVIQGQKELTGHCAVNLTYGTMNNYRFTTDCPENDIEITLYNLAGQKLDVFNMYNGKAEVENKGYKGIYLWVIHQNGQLTKAGKLLF